MTNAAPILSAIKNARIKVDVTSIRYVNALMDTWANIVAQLCVILSVGTAEIVHLQEFAVVHQDFRVGIAKVEFARSIASMEVSVSKRTNAIAPKDFTEHDVSFQNVPFPA